jgi:hypothetical protein
VLPLLLPFEDWLRAELEARPLVPVDFVPVFPFEEGEEVELLPDDVDLAEPVVLPLVEALIPDLPVVSFPEVFLLSVGIFVCLKKVRYANTTTGDLFEAQILNN